MRLRFRFERGIEHRTRFAVLLSLAVSPVCLLAATRVAAGESPDAAPGPVPSEIVARTFENLYGFSSIQRVEIRARPKDGQAFLRRAQVLRRGADEGLNRMLVRFLGPGDLRGIGLLLLERPDLTYDAFLYQPALRRVRRVTIAQRQDSFFGTDLSFEDLEARRAAQWSTELVERAEVAHREAWVIELTPRGVPSGYERIVGWFDRELPVLLRAEFHRNGRRIKTLAIEPDAIRKIEGHYVPTEMEFRGESGSVTRVRIPEIDVLESIPSEKFTTSALEFGDERSDRRLDGLEEAGDRPL
jgi:hypothetical protein